MRCKVDLPEGFSQCWTGRFGKLPAEDRRYFDFRCLLVPLAYLQLTALDGLPMLKNWSTVDSDSSEAHKG